MILTIVKAVVSAGVILAVNYGAKKSPKLGGAIAALPLISLLSATWLLVDGRNNDDIASFLESVLWGYFPSAGMLITVAFCLRNNLNLFPSIGIGVCAWLVVNGLLQIFLTKTA